MNEAHDGKMKIQYTSLTPTDLIESFFYLSTLFYFYRLNVRGKASSHCFSVIYFLYVIKDCKQQRLTYDLDLTELLIQLKNNYLNKHFNRVSLGWQMIMILKSRTPRQKFLHYMNP